jgi:hypothetical protein
VLRPNRAAKACTGLVFMSLLWCSIIMLSHASHTAGMMRRLQYLNITLYGCHVCAGLRMPAQHTARAAAGHRVCLSCSSWRTTQWLSGALMTLLMATISWPWRQCRCGDGWHILQNDEGVDLVVNRNVAVSWQEHVRQQPFTLAPARLHSQRILYVR